MNIIHFSENNSLVGQYLYELRSETIQKDPMRCRRNVERLGEIMAYEISKTLDYTPKKVKTVLGESTVQTPDNKIVLGAILRAALPFHNGFLRYFDRAENAFISAYRKYTDKLKFDIHIEYIAAASLKNKTLILCDPMLATGSSMELSYRALLSKGKPSKVHFVTLIASQAAIDHLSREYANEDITLWVGAIDPILNDHAYIVPGLGDAGDLVFGEKI